MAHILNGTYTSLVSLSAVADSQAKVAPDSVLEAGLYAGPSAFDWAIANAGIINGTTGTAGNVGTPAGAAGSTGVTIATGTLANRGTIAGGAGGIGGSYGIEDGNGGTGGGGGTGVSIGTGTVVNLGAIAGGTGGSGSNGPHSHHRYAAGGAGGPGGAGVSLTAGDLTNFGTIRGGSGGPGGTGNGNPGAAGAGVVISANPTLSGGATIDNAGTIAGAPTAVAVNAGASATIIEQPGGSFAGGNIQVSTGASATLALAVGPGTGLLDAGTIAGVRLISVFGTSWAIDGITVLQNSPSIDIGGASTLAVGGTLSSNGALDISGSGQLAVAGALRVGPGTDPLTGGLLDIEPAPTMTETGTLSAASVEINSGATLAVPAGGSLTLFGGTSGAGTIALGSLALLALTGDLSSAVAFSDSGTGDLLKIAKPGSVDTGPISNFVAGDTIELANFPMAGSGVNGQALTVDNIYGGVETLNFASGTDPAALTLTQTGINVFITHN